MTDHVEACERLKYTGYVTGPVGSEIATERGPQAAKLLIPELRKWTDLQAIVRQFKSGGPMLSFSKSNAKVNFNISRSNWTEESF
jgi:hypothetical protein